MNDIRQKKIFKFVEYWKTLKGDEKGESQVFCDRLFQAFGHEGYKEAGATLEYRIKSEDKRTKFADLLWKPRLLMEMKKRGQNLQNHYRQALDYWFKLVPHRPKYVILCNFDEFWIYDFDLQVDEPVDKVRVDELEQRYTCLNFLFPEERKPLFGNDRVAVTREAADKVATIFNSLVVRGVDREVAQRFILQCVVSMFSEDFGLLPKGLFTELVISCVEGDSSYDLLGALFKQMNSPKIATGGRYRDVKYFNGGLFSKIEPIDLSKDEIFLLENACKEDWSKVQPPIFGTLFQNSMDKSERHALGAHFTSEADIQKVVIPTIVQPWQEKIESATSLKNLLTLYDNLLSYKVLDPACGSGNFLYIAFREIKKIELDLLDTIYRNLSSAKKNKFSKFSRIKTQQLFGIDKVPFAVELAKVTLMLAKEISIKEANSYVQSGNLLLPVSLEPALPLDNLDSNIVCADALFSEWPTVDAIVGNPPYIAKNKKIKELGRAYVNDINKLYPDISGRADYCAYWFRKSHDALKENDRAGLVGTNTIRQNFSREGSLDYIINNKGIITNAVSSQVWSGDAVVHVSIVNWIKGAYRGDKYIYEQDGDKKNSPWKVKKVENINSSLSFSFDTSKSMKLSTNCKPKHCYQGLTHGNDGFLLDSKEAFVLLLDKPLSEFLNPYIIGNDLIGTPSKKPSRFCINLNKFDNQIEARKAGKLFERVKKDVLPSIENSAREECQETGEKNGPRQAHLNKWWKFWRDRPALICELNKLSRYIACVRVTKRPIFEFIESSILPNDSLQVFGFDDDYSFGILQSSLHWEWFSAKCSTMKRDPRYTSESVFDTFPWPQGPSVDKINAIASASSDLRNVRNKLIGELNMSLRELYKTMSDPGKNPLRDAHSKLDDAVFDAYSIKKGGDHLKFLFELNLKIFTLEKKGKPVIGPGLPDFILDKKKYVTDDCVKLYS